MWFTFLLLLLYNWPLLVSCCCLLLSKNFPTFYLLLLRSDGIQRATQNGMKDIWHLESMMQKKKTILSQQSYCAKSPFLLWYYALSTHLFFIPCNATVYQKSITGHILCLVMSDAIRIFAQVKGGLRNSLATEI